MTVHAWEEMDDDGLSVFDVENAVLSGRIVSRQTDQPFGDRKYLIRGRPLEGSDSVYVYTEKP